MGNGIHQAETGSGKTGSLALAVIAIVLCMGAVIAALYYVGLPLAVLVERVISLDSDSGCARAVGAHLHHAARSDLHALCGAH